MDHRPGQYVQVEAISLEGPIWRAYSISSPPHQEGIVELVVRWVPGGICSTYLHRVAVGETVRFTGPYGEFHLDEHEDTELICIGGGCGIAPMRSIIRHALHRWPTRPVRLFFGARGPADVLCREEFAALARAHPSFIAVYALSDPLPEGTAWDGETGFVHLSVDRHLQGGPRRQAFLCGPEAMVEAVRGVLADKGLAPDHIFHDKF